MTTSRHIIQKQVLELTTDREERAKELQERARELYYQEVLPELDKLFSRYAANGTTFSIPRLEVDLGEVPLEDLDKQFAHQVIGRVRERLDQLMAKARAGDQSEIAMKPAENGIWEAFLHFLKTGYLPWWAAGGSIDQVKIMELVSKGEEAKRTALRKALDNRNAVQRLVWQFDEPVINAIIEALDSVNNFAQSYSGALSELLEGLGISLTKKDLNKVVLAALIEYPPDKDEEEFVSALIMRLTELPSLRPEQVLVKLQKITPASKEGRKLINAWRERLQQQSKSSQSTGEEEGVSRLSEIEEEVYIQNAGMVLLWPYLQRFFQQVGLLGESEFLNQEAAFKGIHLLEFVVTGEEKSAEHHLPLNKILCGLDIQIPVPKGIELSTGDKKESEELLHSVIKNWPALKNTSIEGFRNSFLIREGRLTQKDDGWELLVEQRGYDVLLDKLPWSIQLVKLPWMPKPIHVQW